MLHPRTDGLAGRARQLGGVERGERNIALLNIFELAHAFRILDICCRSHTVDDTARGQKVDQWLFSHWISEEKTPP
jgi:hypothetical protein